MLHKGQSIVINGARRKVTRRYIAIRQSIVRLIWAIAFVGVCYGLMLLACHLAVNFINK